MTEFKEKLRSLSFPRKYGETERRPVIRDDDGSVGGHHVIHWDGSQDAEITPRPIAVSAKVQGKEED
jgi:hypothetical protein